MIFPEQNWTLIAIPLPNTQKANNKRLGFCREGWQPQFQQYCVDIGRDKSAEAEAETFDLHEYIMNVRKPWKCWNCDFITNSAQRGL
jgi:hypothetical protein